MMHSQIWLRRLGLLLLLGGLGGCRAASPQAASSTATPVASTTPGQGATVPTEQTVAPADGTGTPINPPRVAHLVAGEDNAQINLRSQPTTQSPSPGYGVVGDEVHLWRLAEGEGGYTWYYAQFAQSGTEGWVRGDFIDTHGQATTGASRPASQTSCSPDPQKAYFETRTFVVYICTTASGLRFISTNKETQESLTLDGVQDSQGTFVAINGNQQYHINDGTLAVYQVSNGEYTQLDGEAVIKHQRN